jgi:hypothetical protein
MNCRLALVSRPVGICLASLLAAKSLVGFAGRAVAAPVDTIALTQTQAPGTAANTDFANFLSVTSALGASPVPPTISAGGEVTFYGQLIGPGTTQANNTGIWSGTPGAVVLAARAGSSAGVPASAAVYQSFAQPFPPQSAAPYPVPMSSSGALAYGALLTGGNVSTLNDEGIWSGPASGPTIQVHEGDPAPPTPSTTTFHSTSPSQATFSPPLINNVGHIGFGGALANGQLGIWAGSAGSLQLVAQTGQQAPGTATGVNFANTPFISQQPFFFSPTAMNASDAIAFTSGLAGPGVTPLNSGGIWAGSSVNVALVARAGDPAPGLAPGTTFTSPVTGSNPFSTPDINASGHVAFSAATMSGSGIWLSGAAGLGLVAASGGQAPGMPAGVAFVPNAFAGFPGVPVQAPLLNSHDALAFGATVAGPGISGANNAGIWEGLSGSLNLIAQSGNQAPGAPVGVTFAIATPQSLLYPTIALNSLGQVAFSSGASDGSVGIWGTDTAGQLREVVRTGDLLQIAPGDERTVVTLALLGGSGNSDGRPSGLADNGQLAFRASFADGSSGIFVSSVLATPEPSSLALALLAATALIVSLARRGASRLH